MAISWRDFLALGTIKLVVLLLLLNSSSCLLVMLFKG
jgi:hypothetical protein